MLTLKSLTAPDRGGKEEDTDNYVALLQTLRQTFESSPRKYGLTFTIPSSYWYLRWFNLPDMLKYADWLNLMSYDLHGKVPNPKSLGSSSVVMFISRLLGPQ